MTEELRYDSIAGLVAAPAAGGAPSCARVGRHPAPARGHSA